MIKAAEEKKTKLESQLDDAESKSRDLTSKLKYLNLEHEYQNIESGRKSKGIFLTISIYGIYRGEHVIA